MLNLGTGSYSWFLVNGYGCKATFSDNITIIDDPYRPRRPELVENCLLDYSWVEVIHSGVQCLLAVSVMQLSHDVQSLLLSDIDCGTSLFPLFTGDGHRGCSNRRKDIYGGR